VKGGFRIASLGVALALSATLVIASHARADSVAKIQDSCDRGQVKHKYEKNHFYNEFPNDDDRRAYEDGYERVWNGKRTDEQNEKSEWPEGRLPRFSRWSMEKATKKDPRSFS
jgi:opacity protein-like surface antigen